MKLRAMIFLSLLVTAWSSVGGAIQGNDSPVSGRQDYCDFAPPTEIANGKKIVLLAGDEEYRSEEALPMLGKILSQRHGFRCVVLFSINPATGEIDPDNQTNIPGMHHLQDADLIITAWRFRRPPDSDMKFFADYVAAGKPIVGLRTATHAFRFTKDDKSGYADFSYDSAENPGGFGRKYLGETWISHHGKHGGESTRGVIESANATHPILKGVDDVWGPTDVYGITTLPENSVVLMRGSIRSGMQPTDEAVVDKRNDPMMPLVWVRELDVGGTKQKIFTTTMGSSTDLACEDLRRLVVNSAFWCTNQTDKITEGLNVEPVGEYAPTPFGFGKYTRGKFPKDHNLPAK